MISKQRTKYANWYNIIILFLAELLAQSKHDIHTCITIALKYNLWCIINCGNDCSRPTSWRAARLIFICKSGFRGYRQYRTPIYRDFFFPFLFWCEWSWLLYRSGCCCCCCCSFFLLLQLELLSLQSRSLKNQPRSIYMWRVVYGCCCCCCLFSSFLSVVFFLLTYSHRVSIWWLPCFMTWLVLFRPVLPCFALLCLALLSISRLQLNAFIYFLLMCVFASSESIAPHMRVCWLACSFVRVVRSFARIKKCKIQSEHTRNMNVRSG